MKVDLVVVGSGAGGLTTAISAADSGLKVLVLESTKWCGGTTALSGGGVWVPGNHYMKEIGIEDSYEEAKGYLKNVLGEYYEDKKIDVYLKYSSEMLNYLEEKTDVKLMATDIPDYEPSNPGWKKGRCLLTESYDGRALKENINVLRPPLKDMGIFESMQISPMDIYVLKEWYKSLNNFKTTVSLMVGYLRDRLTYGRGRRLCNGNALAGMLLKSAIDKGVTVWTEAPAIKLIVKEGVVKGVVCRRNGEEKTVESTKGVVLASGGFGANSLMREKYIPMANAGWSFQPEGCQGDGINMALELGGKIAEKNKANGIWVPGSELKSSKGVRRFPSLFFDRHCPGSIMVDGSTGTRFVNEGFHYQNFGEVVHKKNIKTIWMISDSSAVSKYGMGMIKPKPFSPKSWIEKGYAKTASTIHDLADLISVPQSALEATVAEFNKNAKKGVDHDYGRGEDEYSRYMGDAENKPNPSLGPVQKPPFYAIKISPCDLSTMVGLITDEESRVLKDGKEPIPNLYAVGLDSNSLMKGCYPGGGTSLGPAMTFGYLLGRKVASSRSKLS